MRSGYQGIKAALCSDHAASLFTNEASSDGVALRVDMQCVKLLIVGRIGVRQFCVFCAFCVRFFVEMPLLIKILVILDLIQNPLIIGIDLIE